MRLYLVEALTVRGDFELLGVCNMNDAYLLLNGRAGRLTPEGKKNSLLILSEKK